MVENKRMLNLHEQKFVELNVFQANIIVLTYISNTTTKDFLVESKVVVLETFQLNTQMDQVL